MVLTPGEVNEFLEAMQEAREVTVITTALLTEEAVDLTTGYFFVSTVVHKNIFVKIHLMTPCSHFCFSLHIQKYCDFYLQEWPGLTLVSKQVTIIHYWLFVIPIYTKFVNHSGNRLSCLSLR